MQSFEISYYKKFIVLLPFFHQLLLHISSLPAGRYFFILYRFFLFCKKPKADFPESFSKILFLLPSHKLLPHAPHSSVDSDSDNQIKVPFLLWQHLRSLDSQTVRYVSSSATVVCPIFHIRQDTYVLLLLHHKIAAALLFSPSLLLQNAGRLFAFSLR